MPQYSYFCEPCKEYFDALRKIADRETATCPFCEKPAPKTISAPAGIVNGYLDPGKMYVRKK